DTCPGDSGGPVYLLGDGEAPWLVGVTSRGVDNSDATCGDGGIYTYAPAYRGWIIDSAGGLFPPSDEPGAGGAGGQGGTGGDDFIDDDEGGGGDDGCSAAPNTPGSGWLAAISLLALRRRRRASAGAC
ncbi:MAG: trypsin-like serine protease, partial [Myxococcales bacterium]|nr:trypsin-like serine protease [Myxococcales bacterium]